MRKQYKNLLFVISCMIMMNNTVYGIDRNVAVGLDAPVVSIAPIEPEESEVPKEPEEPTEPEIPQEPEEPTEPETPQEPEEPTTPEIPQEPEVPEEPTEPIEPEMPEVLEFEESYKPEIILDGRFDDWEGKPFIDDSADDGEGNNSQYKIKAIQYFADEQYLYLKIERPKSSGYNTYEAQVVFFNGSAPKSNIWVPWLNKENPWDWKTTPGTTIKVQLEKGTDGYDLVKVEGAGIYERTYSGGANGTVMEFRIPLDALGLVGVGKNIQFNVKSDIRQDAPKQDWAYDNGPIYDTTGPIFGKLTGIILLIGTGLVAMCYKRNSSKTN